MDAAECIIFAGPSKLGLTNESRSALGLEWRPPAKRGDVDSLLEEGRRPATIAVVDGRFHSCLSLGHKELLRALSTGWVVWGLSSMGAIRAYEMREFGIRGFGHVFREFFQHEDFQDDEVALLHAREEPFHPFSEPLIHCREAIRYLVSRDLVSEADARDTIMELKSRWYGERTLELFEQLLVAKSPDRVAVLNKEISEFDRFRLKTLDLEQFVQERPWKA